MIQYRVLKKKPAIFRNFTGLSTKAFQRLLPTYCQTIEHEDDLDNREAKRKHIRQPDSGGGISIRKEDFDDLVIETACSLHKEHCDFPLVA